MVKTEAILVDIRPEGQRAIEGSIAGALVPHPRETRRRRHGGGAWTGPVPFIYRSGLGVDGRNLTGGGQSGCEFGNQAS
jgi:hypothetical protein